MNETIGCLVTAHRSGARTPADTVAECFARIRRHADPALFERMDRMLRSPNSTLLRWGIVQCLFWIHGVHNLYDLTKSITRFDISPV